MHVIALLVASSLCNPCSDPEILPPVVDVSVAAAVGGAGGLGTVVGVLFIPLSLLQFAGVIGPSGPVDPGVVVVAIGAITVVYALGSGVGAAVRSNARGYGNPVTVGVVSATLALASAGGAFATAVALGSGPGTGVIGLGVIAGGAVITGVAAGVTAAATE